MRGKSGIGGRAGIKLRGLEGKQEEGLEEQVEDKIRQAFAPAHRMVTFSMVGSRKPLSDDTEGFTRIC